MKAVSVLMLRLMLDYLFKKLLLMFCFNSTGLVDETDSQDPGLEDLVFASITMLDASFEAIIEVCFKVVAQCPIIESRQCASKQTIELDEVLCPVPECHVGSCECQGKDVVLDLVFPVLV